MQKRHSHGVSCKGLGEDFNCSWGTYAIQLDAAKSAHQFEISAFKHAERWTLEETPAKWTSRGRPEQTCQEMVPGVRRISRVVTFDGGFEKEIMETMEWNGRHGTNAIPRHGLCAIAF